MSELIVRKLNLKREETWRYRAKVLARTPDAVLIEAPFNREDTPFHGVTFGWGDPFTEVYYRERWYNIYEVRDRADGHIKCWYCNVSMPAEVEEGEIRFVDLALDLLVYPDGRQLVLDEDEFEALEPSAELRAKAQEALEELKRIVRPQEGYRVKI